MASTTRRKTAIRRVALAAEYIGIICEIETLFQTLTPEGQIAPERVRLVAAEMCKLWPEYFTNRDTASRLLKEAKNSYIKGEHKPIRFMADAFGYEFSDVKAHMPNEAEHKANTRKLKTWRELRREKHLVEIIPSSVRKAHIIALSSPAAPPQPKPRRERKRIKRLKPEDYV